MNLIEKILQIIRDIFSNLFGGRTMPSRWRPSIECEDFEKVTIPFLDKTITVNRLYMEKFQDLDFWLKLNQLQQNVVRVDSFACRLIGVGGSWSFHSFGQAIDINPVQFPASNLSQGGTRYTLPSWYNTFLDIARGQGFRVGADWQTYYDPMHIEIGNRLR